MAVLVDPSLKRDFEILSQHFGIDCSDVGDLDEIARLMATKSKPESTYIKDCMPPWEKVYNDYILAYQSVNDHDSAWLEVVAQYPLAVQQALRNVMQVLINQHSAQNIKTRQQRKIRTKEYLAQFNKLGYEFGLNLFDDTVYLLHQNSDPEILSDIVFSEVYRALVDTGMLVNENNVRHAINVAAKSKPFHPVRDYLNSLSWDGQPHIANLASHFEDKYGIFSIYLRRWLIGAVARVFIKTQNPMLVLDGKQGLGKSYFARWLVHDLNVFNEGPINPENKDDQLRLMSTWIWEVKELGSTFRKADIEALKSFLTLETVRNRRPYAHYDVVKPAITSFIGTINNVEGFLSDPTGSRRFNITKILSIDWDYKDTIDRNQIWAEAVAAFFDREPWLLTSEEQESRDKINEDYAVEDPLEDALVSLFEIDPKQNWWMATSDIIKILEDPMQGALRMGSSRATAMALARVMTKFGCEKKFKITNGIKLRGYAGIRRQIP